MFVRARLLLCCLCGLYYVLSSLLLSLFARLLVFLCVNSANAYAEGDRKLFNTHKICTCTCRTENARQQVQLHDALGCVRVPGSQQHTNKRTLEHSNTQTNEHTNARIIEHMNNTNAGTKPCTEYICVWVTRSQDSGTHTHKRVMPVDLQAPRSDCWERKRLWRANSIQGEHELVPCV